MQFLQSKEMQVVRQQREALKKVEDVEKTNKDLEAKLGENEQIFEEIKKVE